MDGDVAGGGLKFEPYVEIGAGVPATASRFIRRGIEGGVCRIAGAPIVEIGQFDGSGFEVIIHGVIDGERESSSVAGVIIVVNRDVVPFPGSKAGTAQADIAVLAGIAGTGDLRAGFGPDGGQGITHRSFIPPDFYLDKYLGGGSFELKPAVEVGAVGPAAAAGFIRSSSDRGVLGFG